VFRQVSRAFEILKLELARLARIPELETTGFNAFPSFRC